MQRRTWTEQSAQPGRCLLIPVGSFEQHGPHLPLATDSIVASTICCDAALQRDVDVAPTFAYGASGEHAGFAGLLSLGTDVTAAALTELIRSARPTWRSVVIVSGHGGNAAALAQVERRARSEGDRVAVWMARDDRGDPHAGATETSFILTVDEMLVRADLAPASVPLPPEWAATAARDGVRAISATGVLGDPRSADLATGWTLRRRWCAEVVAMIDELGEDQ